jgi:hypothetical protein
MIAPTENDNAAMEMLTLVMSVHGCSLEATSLLATAARLVRHKYEGLSHSENELAIASMYRMVRSVGIDDICCEQAIMLFPEGSCVREERDCEICLYTTESLASSLLQGKLFLLPCGKHGSDSTLVTFSFSKW